MLFKAANSLKLVRAGAPKIPAKKLRFHLRCFLAEREVECLEGYHLATASSALGLTD
jgi:hypothetical protein